MVCLGADVDELLWVEEGDVLYLGDFDGLNNEV